MLPPRQFVYVIRTEQEPARYYTGLTADVDGRLMAHNNGQCPTTASARPWKLDVVIRFADQARATRLERYLKSGSGAAFAKRHLR
jgi:predicted GIY-YIG superfamily endonuclease